MLDFAGRWWTTFGPMELTQDGDEVRGSYTNRGRECSLHGTLDAGALVIRYEEPGESGEGRFELPRHGKFVGRWRRDGEASDGEWRGHREWDGIWDTSFGRMRLVQEADRVHGSYEGPGPSRVEGRIEDGQLTLRYEEPQAGGEAWFALGDDLATFVGQWRPDGREAWSTWEGRRVRPEPNLTWLVVIEAHWQRSLADREYSFGNMLKEFFARLSHVQVRQRYFNDEVSLDHWCRELLYVPEPAVVLIASHGTPQGLSVHGKTIDTQRVLESLRDADNVELLHFSACLVMREEEAGDFVRRVETSVPFPISGYTTSVDWGGSAIIEFNYLDLLLAKGLPPEEAAERLTQLIAYAGDDVVPGSPYASAGFRFFRPGGVPQVFAAASLPERGVV